MNNISSQFAPLDFECFYRNGNFKLVFQKDSNIFKYLSRDNKVLEYEEILEMFDLNRAEKQIVETLEDDGFYLVGEYERNNNIGMHVLKFMLDKGINPENGFRQVERKLKRNIEGKETSLIFIKAGVPNKTSILRRTFSEYIRNNILKK